MSRYIERIIMMSNGRYWFAAEDVVPVTVVGVTLPDGARRMPASSIISIEPWPSSTAAWQAGGIGQLERVRAGSTRPGLGGQEDRDGPTIMITSRHCRIRVVLPFGTGCHPALAQGPGTRPAGYAKSKADRSVQVRSASTYPRSWYARGSA